MDLSPIAEAIRGALTPLPDLTTYSTLIDNPSYPAACVIPDEPWIDYQSAFSRGLVTLRWKIVLLVSGGDRQWQGQLLKYCSAGIGVEASVIDALEHSNPDDPTLPDGSFGLANTTSVVGDVTGWGRTQVGQVEKGTCAIGLTVYCPRT